MKYLIPVILIIGITITSCDKKDPPETGPVTPELLFKSGFEEGTRIAAPVNNYHIISGTDAETGFNWPIRILGSNFSGVHRIQDDGGPAIENYFETVENAEGEETTALFQRVNYDIGVTQTPYQINNIDQNPTELYMTYWMKTDDTSLEGSDKWRALWEFKTDNYNENNGNGFRMIAFMATDLNGELHWLFQGDKNPLQPIWQVRNRDIPVIRNEWFKVSYFIKWSNGDNGYAAMHVNDQLIAEHKGPTTTNSDDMDFIILTQVYGNTHPMHQWVDDIEIWQGLPTQN